MTARETVDLCYSEHRPPTDAEIDLVIREGSWEDVASLNVKLGCQHKGLRDRAHVLLREQQNAILAR